MKVIWASEKTLEANNLILEERNRQQTQEGYTLAHDDEHTEGQLALLGAAYALSSSAYAPRMKNYEVVSWFRGMLERMGWSFKPADPIRDLVRAGALIQADLERLLRAEKRKMAEPTRFADLVRLPRWQGHKFVADKIVKVRVSGTRWDLACGATIEVSQELRNRVPCDSEPEDGYYVRYEDGHESWFPAEAFEKGYTRLP